MKILYTGQRVRILFSYEWPELDNTEGMVLGPSPTGGTCEWDVVPDLWGTHCCPSAPDFAFCPSSDQLEPILKPDATPCDAAFKEEMDALLERTTAAQENGDE